MGMRYSLIRYPGSKDKISKRIIAEFPVSVAVSLFQRRGLEYREPFFGSGAVGCDVLNTLPRTSSVWLNDRDYWIVCLWNTIRDQPRELIQEIERLQPSPDGFYKLKGQDGNKECDPILAAASKLALHQWSFSGLGAMAGGPIGGRKQSSEYNVDCRWNVTRLKAAIAERHELFRGFPRVNVTARDFADLIDGAPVTSFIYADPPYYEKGPELYKYSMTDDDHRRLAASLRSCRADWVLSYDDHPFVRDLYESWADIKSVELTYTTAIAKDGVRRKNSEIIITPRKSGRKAA